MYYIIRRIISKKEIECTTLFCNAGKAYIDYVKVLDDWRFPAGQRVELLQLDGNMTEPNRLKKIASGKTKGGVSATHDCVSG